MNIIKSKTEKFLLSIAVVLSIGLFVTVFNVNYTGPVSAEEESSESGSEESGTSEKSGEKSELSTDDKSEASVESNEELSEKSVASTPATGQNQEFSTASTKSVSDVELSETEISEKSSTESEEVSEKSELSLKSINGFDEVVSVEGNVAKVKRGERLFFLMPVNIESEVTVDRLGNVISERQSFWNRLLSFFSY